MLFNPKVSIVIPVYNGSNYLKDAIDSALVQTYDNLEILVINDGSMDDWATENIALSFWDKIKYFSKPNGWVASALNYGIKKMSWEYFSWLSHDDLYFPGKIEKQILFLSNLKDKNVIISSDYEIVDNNLRPLNTMKLNYSPDNLAYSLLMNWFLNGCTLLIPREVFKIIGVFENTLKTTQDYHLWFRMIKKFDFINLAEVLVASRQHEWQDSRKKMNTAIFERKNLENFVFEIFPIQDLKKSSGSKMPDLLFYIITRIKLSKYRILGTLAYIADRIGLYAFMSKLYRRVFY